MSFWEDEEELLSQRLVILLDKSEISNTKFGSVIFSGKQLSSQLLKPKQPDCAHCHVSDF